jgi:hypothetical protein
MFAIGKTGFHITFENGWTVSVQFGHGNYCKNRNIGRLTEAALHGGELSITPTSSPDAEIAAWDKDGKWYDFGNDIVLGWQNTKQVLDFLNKVEKF